MRNQKFLLVLYLLLISLNSNGQTISDLSLKICDSMNNHKYIETDTVVVKHAQIYSELLTEYLLTNIKTKPKNFLADYNSLNYKLTTDLNKTCKNYLIKTPYILPFSTYALRAVKICANSTGFLPIRIISDSMNEFPE